MQAKAMLEELGVAIVMRREELNMTQQQLADAVGLSRFAVGEYERGNVSMKAITLWKIARVLRVSMGQLLK